MDVAWRAMVRVACCPSRHDATSVKHSTVARSLLVDMTGYLAARGVDPEPVLQRAGVPRDDTDVRDARLHSARMARFWAEAVRASGDQDLGLHMAVHSNAGALDIVGYVMLTAPTAATALARGARLMRLLNDGLDLVVTTGARSTTCTLVRLHAADPLWDDPRQVTESILAGLVHQLRQLTERAVVPRVVRFRHARPLHGAREHERLFGTMPEFSAASDEVELHATDLDLELRSANATLMAAFEAHADAALAVLGAQHTIAGRVATEIVARLKGEAPDAGTIASALAMSTRSLQRALNAESTTFQQVLDDVRRELAMAHLARTDATVAKVAWLVGFSEPSAFHRAWKRWTGTSPRERGAPPSSSSSTSSSSSPHRSA
jgi:AraC-like DNA-binding protein